MVLKIINLRLWDYWMLQMRKELSLLTAWTGDVYMILIWFKNWGIHMQLVIKLVIMGGKSPAFLIFYIWFAWKLIVNSPILYLQGTRPLFTTHRRAIQQSSSMGWRSSHQDSRSSTKPLPTTLWRFRRCKHCSLITAQLLRCRDLGSGFRTSNRNTSRRFKCYVSKSSCYFPSESYRPQSWTGHCCYHSDYPSSY